MGEAIGAAWDRNRPPTGGAANLERHEGRHGEAARQKRVGAAPGTGLLVRLDVRPVRGAGDLSDAECVAAARAKGERTARPTRRGARAHVGEDRADVAEHRAFIASDERGVQPYAPTRLQALEANTSTGEPSI